MSADDDADAPPAAAARSDDAAERTLLEAIATARDEQALANLYKLYRPRLGGFLYRFTSDAGLVEQVFNDVMLTVWRKAHQYRGDSLVSTWIFTIGRRRFLRLIHQQRAQDRIKSALKPLTETSTRDDHQSVDTERWLQQALLELPPKQRLVIELRYYADASYEEIAIAAGCPVNTVKTRMHHARKKLRTLLDRDVGLSDQPDDGSKQTTGAVVGTRDKVPQS